MREEFKIQNIMTKDLVSFDPNIIMFDIIEQIEQSDFHHFPIVNEDGVCIGVLSRSDYLQLQDGFTRFGDANASINNERFMKSLLVSEVMTSPAIQKDINDSVESIVELFLENKYRSVVITKQGKCVGIVTPVDLLEALYKSVVINA